MALALICPKCKSQLQDKISNPSGRSSVLRLGQSAFCPKCRTNVNALILETDGRLPGKVSRSDAGKIDKEIDILSSAPVFDVFMPLGNTAKFAKFLLARAFIAVLAFFAFSGVFAVSLNNPYFLVLSSSAFLVIAHILMVFSGPISKKLISVLKDDLMTTIAGITLAGTAFIAVFLPIIAFELLLLSLNPLFFLADIVAVILSFILLGGED